MMMMSSLQSNLNSWMSILPLSLLKPTFSFFNSLWAFKKMLLHGSNFSVLTYWYGTIVSPRLNDWRIADRKPSHTHVKSAFWYIKRKKVQPCTFVGHFKLYLYCWLIISFTPVLIVWWFGETQFTSAETRFSLFFFSSIHPQTAISPLYLPSHLIYKRLPIQTPPPKLTLLSLPLSLPGSLPAFPSMLHCRSRCWGAGWGIPRPASLCKGRLYSL